MWGCLNDPQNVPARLGALDLGLQSTTSASSAFRRSAESSWHLLNRKKCLFLASQGTFTFTLGFVASPPHIFFQMRGGKGAHKQAQARHTTQDCTLGRHGKKALSPLGASSSV